MEANVAITKKKFSRGLSSRTKVGPSKLNAQIKKENGKTPKQNNRKKAT